MRTKEKGKKGEKEGKVPFPPSLGERRRKNQQRSASEDKGGEEGAQGETIFNSYAKKEGIGATWPSRQASGGGKRSSLPRKERKKGRIPPSSPPDQVWREKRDKSEGNKRRTVTRGRVRRGLRRG